MRVTWNVLIKTSILLFALSMPSNAEQAVRPRQATDIRLGDVSAIPEQSYEDIKAKIKQKQDGWVQAYREGDEAQRENLLSEVGSFLGETLTQKMWPHWLETRWEFEGTSQTPREGAIACGYFVTTCLQHLGFSIERIRLAQIASETMIRELVDPASVKKFSNVPIDAFVSALQDLGEGIYIVGLDNHTGFLWVDENTVWFCHSSYRSPYKVIFEKASSASILTDSRYRVVGKILPQSKLVQNWLQP